MWRYQEFEQPEARLIVAGLEGVYEEEEEEAVESQRVGLHWDQDAVTEETGEQADTPQYPQQTCNLHSTQAETHSVTMVKVRGNTTPNHRATHESPVKNTI